ncbi:hypothetical protein LAZ67_18000272, partial [Cordylochernes scorpioides]
MTYLAKVRKCDLSKLAYELGEVVPPESRIVDLKHLILNSQSYEEEFAKQLLETLIEDRERIEERERIEDRKRIEDRERIERERKEQMVMEFELEKLRIQTTRGNNDTSRSTSNDAHYEIRKLMPKYESKDNDLSFYLILFERQAKRLGLDEDQWAFSLLGLLPYEMTLLIARETEEQSGDYRFVKRLLLKRYKLSPEQFRQKFEKHERSQKGSWRDFAFELRGYFNEWIEGMNVENFDALKDMSVTNQLKKKVPNVLRNHLIDDWTKLNNPDELADKLDEYENVRTEMGPPHWNAKHLIPPSFQQKSARFPNQSEVKETKQGTNVSGQDAARNEISETYPNTLRRMVNRTIRNDKGEPKCFNCNQFGHIARDCPAPRTTLTCRGCGQTGHKERNCTRPKEGLKVANLEVEGLETVPPDVYLKDVKIDNKETVKAMIDTGSSSCLMRESVARRISVDIEPDSTSLYGIGNQTAPAARTVGKTTVDLEIDGIVGREITVFIVNDDAQPYDLLIGRTWTDLPYVSFARIGKNLHIGYSSEFPFANLQEEIKSRRIELRATETVQLESDSINLTSAITDEVKNGYVLFTGVDDACVDSLLEVVDGKTTVPIISAGKGKLRVRKNQCVGRVELLNLDNIVVNLDVAEDSFQTKNEEKREGQDQMKRKRPILPEDINVNHSLTSKERQEILDVVNEYRDCFALGTEELGCTDVTKMDIKEVDGSKPVCLRPYKTTASEREAIREIVREWKDNGIVTETRSPYASPVLLVRKKTGDHRLVVDYRRLNIQTVKDKFPLPRIDDLLEGLRNAKFFTTLDLAHGYLQIPLTDKAKLKTAFITPDDTGQFERMIFGLANAPAEFQRLMHTVLGPLLNKKAFCYLDDVIIPAKDWREMIERLREVLERIRSAKLTLKPSKCEFGRREVEFLGYVISTGGLKPGPRKIKAIEEFPEPKNVHDIRRFLGLTNFFRRFVKDFARKAEPLSRLTKKGSQFEWKEEQRRSFGGLRKDLVEYPVLAHYNPELKTEVHCDASAEGLAGMVLQMDEDGKWRLVYCVSKKTTEAEKMYHSSKLELMAIVWTLDRLRQFLVGIKFTVVTDCQALVYMNAKKTTNPQIARWYNLIQEYDFEIRHKPGEKMAHVDGMSRAPVDDPRDTMEEIVEKNLEVCLTITLEEQILMIQHSDPELRDLIQIFRKDPCDRTVGEQNRINDYSYKGGRLFRMVKNGEEERALYVIPKSMRKSLVVKFHDLMGHFATDWTVNKIKELYWFPSMKRYVRRHVAMCLECLFNKVPGGKQQGFLHPIKSGKRPFSIVHMDHVGPFVRSTKGNQELLVIVDNLTRFVRLSPVRNTSTQNVLKVMKSFVNDFGLPDKIISDRGSCFTSRQFEEFCRGNGIHHTLNSTKHPQGNGMVERVNRTVLSTIATSIEDPRRKDWDLKIKEVERDLNNAVNKTTNKTPFETLHGYSPRYHDGILRRLADEDVDPWTEPDRIQESVRTQIENKQEIMKTYYDKKKCRTIQFEVGEIVVMRHVPKMTGEPTKAQPKYRGPLIITEVLPSDTYRVTQLSERTSGRFYTTTAHISQLKSWHSEEDDSATEESPDEEPEVEDTPRRNPRRSCNARFNRGRLKSRNGRIIVVETPGNETVTRRSRRLQGLQPELSTVLAFPARKKMEREENRPFCHRWRDPTVFSGERGEDSQRWLSDFQRVARYNKWDDSMCLANVIFYLTGTAKCWFENFEEILNSWEEFKIKFCEIFGNKEDTARKAENILRTRAQTSGENVESYIQEVLLLCKQSNPRMSEGEKVSHLIKGVAEEVYQALVGKDISTVDQFVAFCRRFEAFKRMRVAPPRFNRLPNVTTISTAEPENLEALIRRIVREEVQKFMAPPSTFAAQDIDTPSPDLRDVIRSEIQQTLAPISAPRQPESFRPRRQYLPQNDQGYRRRTEGPPNNQRTQWRTEDDRPICFHCGRPGHVARYCRDRRQAFADARLGRETVDFGRPRTENYTMGESGSELSQGRFRNPSPYPHRGRFQAPRRTSQSPARRPSRSPSRRRRNVQALVDSGADYSVISEAFRRSIKAPVFKENGPLLRAADKKPIVTLGKCSLEVQIKGLDIIFDFVVAAECSHDVILGWDFFKATDAIIDCGENKLYLSEAEKSHEWKDLKLCAAMDCVIPPKSFGKIVVTSQDVFGSRDVVVTGSKRLQLEKGLFIPSSLVRFLHGRAVLWVTNSTHQSQVIPSDMKIGTMQDLEVGSISNLDACSEIAGKDEVTSPDVRECLISMISTDLEETKKNRLLTCLNEFSDIFDFEKKSFPVSGEIKHKIDTSDYPPVRQRPYRVSPAERRVIQSEVEKMMETKIIRPSSSPWASPVILVRKKDGSLRFCVDYRRLNKITKKDVYPLPRIDDALDTLSGSRYFSTMDMRSGYWQIEVDDKDREKTAFITPDGLYEFNVMPFGLCNAPATFERMIDNVLRGLKWDMCLCYLDDIVVYGSTFKEHLTRLYKVLRCIQQAGLCLNYKKCHFASRQITILGHVVNEFGTQPDPEKVKAIVHFPNPRNISETRSFLGLSSYYRRFIKSYANKSRPLNSLLKKDEKFIWGEEQDESFRILKQELGSSPVLGHFIEGAETHVHTDASGYGLGAVLVQIQNDAERPIAYASRTLTKAEKNYSTTEKECLAVVWALGKFRPYLYGRPFTVVTDHHSLCWLVGLKDPSGRLARWALKLQEYDINIVYKSGRKHKDADCLSRSPLADTAEIEGHITSIQYIAEEQSKDPHLVGIREKLANENLKGYQMIGGVLYKKNYDPEGKPWLLVVPKQMRHEILKDVHDTPMAGHLGFAKTYDRVRKRFYWPGLYRTVSQYIAHCKECQRRKGVPQKPPGLLVPIPPTTSPFQKIGIDYLGRFPISHTGNRWIIVATDYLTRFAITKAAATAEATELATFLIEDVILKHGAPREIITDRGRNFMSQTIREINNLNGTIHRFTTAYHPQTNGLTERLNKTLTDMISMYVDVDQKNWDNILPYVTFAYNTARQETTGYSPFFLVHGREVETPLDSILPYQPAGTAEDYVGHLVTNAEDARMLARLNILQAQSKDKERYDKKHQEVTYKEGDLVWVFTPVRTVGLSEKLLKRYFGPYRVIRKISSVNYQVEGVTNTRRRRKTQDIVHVVRMKPYHDPEVQEQIAQGHVTDYYNVIVMGQLTEEQSKPWRYIDNVVTDLKRRIYSSHVSDDHLFLFPSVGESFEDTAPD